MSDKTEEASMPLRDAWEFIKEMTSDCPYCDASWDAHGTGGSDDCPYNQMEVAIITTGRLGVAAAPGLSEKLKELSDGATYGPWIRSTHCFQILTHDSMESVTELNVPGGLKADAGRVEKWQKNVKFMVACVNYVRAALCQFGAPQKEES